MRAFFSEEFKSDHQSVATFELQLLFFLKIGDRKHCREFVAQLSDAGVPIDDLDTAHSDAIAVLASQKAIILKSDDGGFTVRSITSTSLTTKAALPIGQEFKLSRFSYMIQERDVLTIRNPLSDRYIEVYDPTYAAVFGNFARPYLVDIILKSSNDTRDARAFVEMLVSAAIVLPTDESGHTEDEREPQRRLWEFHDLLLHSRSRIGKATGAIGSTYSFSDLPEPVSTLAPPENIPWFPLPADNGAGSNVALFDAMAQRRSVRSFADTPLDISDLSRFLHRSVGRLPATSANEGQVRRPYPSGGALYEQRFYIAINRVTGLVPGLYIYDEVRSRVGLVAEASPELDGLLDNAGRTVGAAVRPPALIIITSRFDRVRWKYSGLAYALQLKHVGVIQEAMYLTATALGLGGCALGSGETDLFGALAGLDYFTEGALGEFVLGIPTER